MKLILASTSRYRHELLSRLRLPFEVLAPDVDETPLPDEPPSATALRLSVLKAQAAAASCAPNCASPTTSAATGRRRRT